MEELNRLYELQKKEVSNKVDRWENLRFEIQSGMTLYLFLDFLLKEGKCLK
jgi:hypothetical protein